MGPAAASEHRHRTVGIALCVASACGFGLLAIFATQAYDAGAGITTVLATRFAVAAGAFWAIVALRRALARRGRTAREARVTPPRRVVLTALGLGVGYTVQSASFFGALKHIDASLTSLLLYTFPVLVCCGAIALGRERFEPWKAGALAVATAGTALVLLGGGSGGLHATGVLLALAAAATYSMYLLVADGVLGRIDPWLMSALIASSAAITFVVFGLATGSLDAPSSTGLAWIVAIALFATVLPMGTLLLGMARVGASTGAIVSTIEPVVTVTLAVILLGETLGSAQLFGGVLVLGAVLALQSRSAAGVSAPAAAPPAAAPVAVREPA
jgi:drug/metabolite transporter (DMT)-like permease